MVAVKRDSITKSRKESMIKSKEESVMKSKKEGVIEDERERIVEVNKKDVEKKINKKGKAKDEKASIVSVLKESTLKDEKKEEKPFESDGSDEIISFVPKRCPRCGAWLSIRKLGVWGYYCNNCKFWWGTYYPYPKVEKKKKGFNG
ncbi:MAG: hypothetical protein GWP09_02335 [Nitrospiraceae bacterium]|nr:hypothetical protein [Nitrospiraceae bacterium]